MSANVTDIKAAIYQEQTTEDGVADQFSAQHPEYRYVKEKHRWYHWNDEVWVEEKTLRLYDDIRAFCRQLGQRIEQDSPKDAKNLRRHSTVAAIESMCRADRRHAALPDIWDSTPWLLNTRMGIVDLMTGDIGEHCPDKYMTKMVNASPVGRCPIWLQCLDEWTAGDNELAGFLQRVVGYCLTGSIREHALFFIHGPGRNGKGVFLNTLQGLLGGYAADAPMETFTESRNDRHPTELARLDGPRMVVAEETEEGRRWAESRIKALTGGDSITARFMRGDFFTFQPQFKLLIAGNHKPRLTTVDEAMRARLHLIPFTVTIPKEKRDPDLEEALKSEWNGILKWAIDGCLDYQRQGLNPPATVSDATDRYFEGQDVFSDWLNECCEIGEEQWHHPRPLFDSWRDFANQANERVGKQRDFNDRLEAKGFMKRRSGGKGRRWEGLALKGCQP